MIDISKEWLAIIIAPLFTGIGWVIKWVLDRRKRQAEVTGSEVDNEIKLYTGYQSATKDYSELVDFMSEKLKDTQKNLAKITLEFNRDIQILKVENQKKEIELKNLQEKYNFEIEGFKNTIESMQGAFDLLQAENLNLKKELESLKDGRDKQT